MLPATLAVPAMPPWVDGCLCTRARCRAWCCMLNLFGRQASNPKICERVCNHLMSRILPPPTHIHTRHPPCTHARTHTRHTRANTLTHTHTRAHTHTNHTTHTHAPTRPCGPCTHVLQRVCTAQAAIGPNEDYTCAVKFLEQTAGVELRSPRKKED